LIGYVRSPEFQEKLMQTTLRRPIVPGISLDSRIPNPLLVELPFPNTADVIDRLLFSYLDEQRIPSHAFFVLDVSGSMEGEGLRDLKTAVNNLTGLDNSLTGRFSRFRAREKITVLTFNQAIQSSGDFTIDDTATAGPDMQRIRQFVDDLEAGGNTAIYGTLAQAYQQVAAAQQLDPDRYYSIVLMSDGQNTAGPSLEQFKTAYDRLPGSTKDVRTFTVLFGDADRKAMQEIADLTGGRMFDGTQESLEFIFKQIRGYQ